MQFVNCTPHDIMLNDGTVFPKSGNIARVSVDFTDFDADGICEQVFGEVEGIPEPQENTKYIVSLVVLGATDRDDVVAPATGHPDVVRNDKGHIVSVAGFVSRSR